MNLTKNIAVRTGVVLLLGTIPFSLAYGQLTRPTRWCRTSPAPCILDDFDRSNGPWAVFGEAQIIPSRWTAFPLGNGPIVAERGLRLEMTLPGYSDNGRDGTFGFQYVNTCVVSGDFDIEVDYSLLTWPPVNEETADGNGVRVGLVTEAGSVFRVSLGSSLIDFPGKPREAYSTDFSAGPAGVHQIPTSDLSGTLRMARAGSLVTGYYLSGSSWNTIWSFTKTAADVGFAPVAWSAQPLFTGHSVRAAFDNIILNKGTLKCAVVIDAGHGLLQRSNGPAEYQRPPTATHHLYEDNITSEISFAVRNAMRARGSSPRVFLTREAAQSPGVFYAPFAGMDCDGVCIVDLDKRVEWAEKMHADLMVSVHTNASDRCPAESGCTEVLKAPGSTATKCVKPDGITLCKRPIVPTTNGSLSIHSAQAPAPDSNWLAQFVLGRVVPLGTSNLGVRLKGFNILLSRDFPSTIIEVAHHTNSELAAGQTITDEDRLNNAPAANINGQPYELAVAQAIADAINDYYATK